MDRLRGKTALVTGAAKGIGKAAAERLAQEKAKVAVTDIAETEGRKLAEELRDEGGEAEFWPLNVANEEDVKNVFQSVKDKFGPVDILVNNAGISGTNQPTDEVSKEDWESLMEINVTGVFLCTKHVVPQMRESGGGSIINLSSIYGIIGAADLPPYHASKGAVRTMTKNDALFFAKDKIRVNSVHPGFIWTPLVEELAQESPDGPEAFRQELDSRHPIGHVGEPDDIAWGIVYLASDESKFVTGSELVIDGGYTAR